MNPRFGVFVLATAVLHTEAKSKNLTSFRGQLEGHAQEAFRDRQRSGGIQQQDRKSTRLNSSHSQISYAVFCLKKKNTHSSHTRLFSPPMSRHNFSAPPRRVCTLSLESQVPHTVTWRNRII